MGSFIYNFSIEIYHCSNFSPCISANKEVFFKLPLVIKIVETGPFPLSIFASKTIPFAFPSFGDFRSKISDCKISFFKFV